MNETEKLQQQLVDAEDDPHALGQLLLKYQERLERVIAFRMDRRLKVRLDAADVLQEAFVEASQRLDDYRASADKVSFFIWLRFIALQKLAQLHRHHLGVQARDARRDVAIYNRAAPEATSVVLAAQLLGKITSPSNAAIRAESKVKLEEALSRMEDIDREILALRNFEQLSNGETAELLGLSDSAACNRYFRAVRRLKVIMESVSGESNILND